MADNDIVRPLGAADIQKIKIDGTHDAFARLRTSSPTTLWDAKMSTASHTLFWDDQETSGGGTSSTYSQARASYAMLVSADTAGTRVRQSKQRINYQPGKSQFVALTCILGDAAAGITQRVGLFDENNGLFFELAGTTLSVVRRSKVSGQVVNTKVAQSAWEYDRLDGTRPSQVTLDLTKAQIFFLDFESLQVGTVRFGVFIDGIPVYVHAMDHANLINSAYFSTPNLPIRYEISNDGTGPETTLESICSTVISEGGTRDTGITRYISTNGTHVDANAADTTYAVVGMRLKSANLDSVVKVAGISMFSETSDNFEWLLLLNPTVATTTAAPFTFTDLPNSAVQYARGATVNTCSAGTGTVLAGGWSASSNAVTTLVDSLYYPGAAIDGTADQIVLAVRPLSTMADIQGGITFKEIA